MPPVPGSPAVAPPETNGYALDGPAAAAGGDGHDGVDQAGDALELMCGMCDEEVQNTWTNTTPSAGTPRPDAGDVAGDEAGAGGAPPEGAEYLSKGSVGHPHSCAEACRYMKRKGGCLSGTECMRCHLCFWMRCSRKPAPVAAPIVQAEGEQAIVSIGTRGHPETCAEACKYARRKSGCRDGANCPKCHACMWNRGRPARDERHGSVASDSIDEEQSAETGFFGDSSDKLAELIAGMLTKDK